MEGFIYKSRVEDKRFKNVSEKDQSINQSIKVNATPFLFALPVRPIL